jgi:DNA-binding CsgD family transcriptional regulator/Tfp pilus assembly protein PilF
MTREMESLLHVGEEALGAGDWRRARAAFEQALGERETGEALHGLGTALYWLAEAEAAVRLLERAHGEFRRDDPGQAAFVAIELSLYYLSSLGNLAAAQGWLGRASRLVTEHGLAPLAGWVTLCRAALANDRQDPASGEALAREALATAREADDGDLELCAVAELGASLIERGRVGDGVALLDEAMAGALGGPVDDLGTVIYASCRTIDYCTRAAEIKRAVQWIRAADEFNRRYGSAHIHATCRTRYGAVLFGLGRWDDAERELEAALRMSRSAEPALRADALAALAELRLAQGQVEAAARLLEGLEDHGGATFALATHHVARGELGVAASMLGRRLREVGEATLAGAELLELLGEVEIAVGRADAALARARRHTELAAGFDCELIAARAERALGRALAAVGRRDEALIHIELALSAFARMELVLQCARTRGLLAEALAEQERDRDAAIAAARTALGCFEELGAGPDADRTAALLRSLGVHAARGSGRRGPEILSKREREVLGLLGEGLSNRRIAERLFLSTRTVEHHVRSVLSKLGLANRAEAAAYAARAAPRSGSASD